MKNMDSKNLLYAYFTVEAALILPAAISIILFVIYVMIFQYDRCLLEQDIGALALRGSISSLESRALEEEMEAEIRRIYTDKYVAFCWGETNVTTGYGKIRIAGNGKVNIPFTLSVLNHSENGWNIHANEIRRQINPILIIRAVRKVIEQ